MENPRLFLKMISLSLLCCVWSGCIETTVNSRITADNSQVETLKPNSSLRWAPPKLTNPITIQLGEGNTYNALDKDKDYIIKLPKQLKTGSTTFDGGHNIVIIGGHITIAEEGQPNGMHARALYFKNAVGTVHIEGIKIDNSGQADFDGICINAPQATVQIQNCRITGLTGLHAGTHSDIIQPWGGVKELRIDRLTGSSNYQGLFIRRDLGPIGAVKVSHVDLKALPNLHHPLSYLVWLTNINDKDGSTAYPVTFSDVYLLPLKNFTAGQTVWPHVKTAKAIAAVEENGKVSWPNLESVQGEIIEGMPPGGEFVPEDIAGANYKTPGYR